MRGKAVLLAGLSALVLGAGLWRLRSETPPWRERDPATRLRRVGALATRPDALRRLREVYEHSDDPMTRALALTGAGQAGGAEAADWLAEVAGRDARLGARAGAALGEMRAPVPTLTGLLRGPGTALVRANAARALGAAQPGPAAERAAAALAAVLLDEAQPKRVRAEAALSLGALRQEASAAPLAEALAALLAQRSPDSEQLRIAIVRALGVLRAAHIEGAAAALRTHEGRELSALERLYTERALRDS